MAQKQEMTKKKNYTEEDKSRGMVVLPYVKGLIEKVTIILKMRQGQYDCETTPP